MIKALSVLLVIAVAQAKAEKCSDPSARISAQVLKAKCQKGDCMVKLKLESHWPVSSCPVLSPSKIKDQWIIVDDGNTYGAKSFLAGNLVLEKEAGQKKIFLRE
jgi:hypothetical protein